MVRLQHVSWIAVLIGVSACDEDVQPSRDSASNAATADASSYSADAAGPPLQHDAARASNDAEAHDADTGDADPSDAARDAEPPATGNDAALHDDAAVTDDAAVIEAAPDASVPPSYTRPPVSQASSAPVCFPLQPGYGRDGALCPDTYCIPGSLSSSFSLPSQPRGFVCASSNCYIGEKFSAISIDNEIQLYITLSHPIDTKASSAELRAALLEIAGGSSQPEVVSFVSEASLIEELSNEGGRLHIAGWGMVTGTGVAVPTIPHYCGTEAPSICVVEICQYEVPDRSKPASWFHFDVEAPFNLSHSGDT